MATRKTLPAAEIAAALERLASSIAARHQPAANIVLLGIANGGVNVCRRLSALLASKLGRAVAEGVIDVSFHRDDIGLHPIPPSKAGTCVPADLEGATVILVDDVLFSGRTARAALEEVFSHGRPERVELAILVDRGNRRLPIAADHTGFVEPTAIDERVRVTIAPENADTSADAVVISSAA